MRHLTLLILIILLAGCSYGYPPPSAKPADPASFLLPPPAAPRDRARIALGRVLFNDTRLSGDGRMSCASCHRETLGFGDGRKTAIGSDGQVLPRHTPSLWNVVRAPRLMVDGRAATLEAQALMPMQNPAEMATDLDHAVATLRADPAMRRHFAGAFPDGTAIGTASIARALAAYERTLVSRPARFDRFARGDAKAMPAAAMRGYALFAGRAGCARCHNGWAFSDGSFHDIGLPDADRGRGAITGRARDEHAFRTPSLRDIGRSAPYMHDGSLPDLAAVIDHYADGVVARRHTPARVALTVAERRDLVAFLLALTGEDAPDA